MKTLHNQILLYDEDCPLCKAYTSGFVQAGMLDHNGKKPFTAMSAEEQHFVDCNRAVNEIALVDTENKTVRYGIDSLLHIIGYSFPILKNIGNIKPIHYILQKIYSFISYNRKVIIPGQAASEKNLQCIPAFNYKYRYFYILFAVLCTAVTLFSFSNTITMLPKSNFGRELILAFGQLCFQAIFLLKFDFKTITTYFGNLMTVSVMGSLLLLPLLLLHTFILLPQLLLLGWFGITVLLMFGEHYRRTHLLALPNYLCYTWIAYRIIALIIILNL